MCAQGASAQHSQLTGATRVAALIGSSAPESAHSCTMSIWPRTRPSQSPWPNRGDGARILQIARSVGFVGRVEYRHVYSQAGGAQYGRGSGDAADLPTVFAEALERDANPDDFSLLAMIAHERGRQLLARQPRLSTRLAGVSDAAEEVLASLLGALVLESGPDRDLLIAKATAEVLVGRREPADAIRLITELWNTLGKLL
jgi:hypothetical protein